MLTFDLLPAQQPLQQLFHPVARDLPTAVRHHLITPATAERTWAIERRGQALGLVLRTIGVAQPLLEPLIVHGPHSDFVAMGAADDPNFQSHAGYPVPAHALEDLLLMLDNGLDVFDDLAIVHELPQRARLADTGAVEATRSKFSPEMVEQARRLGAMSGTILRLAALPLIGAAVVGLGAMALVAAPVLAAVAGVDPLICGLLEDEHTGNQVWVLLTKWDAFA